MRKATLLALAIVMPACGGKSSTPSTPTVVATPPPPTRSVISVSFDPSPVIALPVSDPVRPFRAVYTMTVRETAGLACNVNLWTETLLNPVTNLQSGTTQFSAADAIRLAGMNFIAANGSLRIPRDFNYSPGGSAGTGRAVDMNVAVQVIDANGNQINATGTVRIQ